MYSYPKDINSQSSIIETMIVGHKTGRVSIMPSLPSPSNTSYSPHIDNSSLERSGKQKLKFTPDFEASEPVFWRVFREIANANNGLVYYDKLQERLVSTGKFFVGDAVLMIEYVEKIGKIEQTEQYHVYRRKIAAYSPEQKHGGGDINIIKNDDVVRGKFYYTRTDGLSRKEFFPLSSYISVE